MTERGFQILELQYLPLLCLLLRIPPSLMISNKPANKNPQTSVLLTSLRRSVVVYQLVKSFWFVRELEVCSACGEDRSSSSASRVVSRGMCAIPPFVKCRCLSWKLCKQRLCCREIKGAWLFDVVVSGL